jgi:hypothetical protein
MPSDHGIGLDDDEGGTPASPEPGDPDPEDAILAVKLRPVNRALQDAELVAEREVFGDEGGAPGDEQPERIPKDDEAPHRGFHLGMERRIVVGKDSVGRMRKSLGDNADEVFRKDNYRTPLCCSSVPPAFVRL